MGITGILKPQGTLPEKLPKSFFSDSSQNFKVEWNDHHPFLVQLLHTLLEKESLVDVTLAAEGQFIRVHRLILGACSHYFEELLCRDSEKQTIIFLKDVRFVDVKAVVDFMYKGEVNVPEEQLETFLSTARSLRIKGLDFNKGNEPSDSKPTPEEATVKKEDERTPIKSKGPLPLKGRNSTGQRIKKKKSIASADAKPRRSSLPASRVVESKKESSPKPQTAEQDIQSMADVDQKMEVDPLEKRENDVEKDDGAGAKEVLDIVAISVPGSSFAVVPTSSVTKGDLNGKEASPVPESMEIPPVGGKTPPPASLSARRCISSTPLVLFNCDLCPYSTPTNFKLRMHIRNKHVAPV